MDAELRRLLFQRLQTVQRDDQFDLTPYAVVMLTVIIEAIADQTSERVRMTVSIRDAQLKAIESIPNLLAVTSRAYGTRLIDGSMLLTVMPRFMSGFCPPFEDPPNY